MGRDSPERRTPRNLQEAETVECPKCSDVFLHKRSLERHLRVNMAHKYSTGVDVVNIRTTGGTIYVRTTVTATPLT